MAESFSFRLEEGATGATGATLRLEGALRRDGARALAELLAKHQAGKHDLSLDLSGVQALDSAAVGVLVHAWRHAQQAGARLDVLAPSEQARRSLSMFRIHAQPAAATPQAGVVEDLGDRLVVASRALRDFLQLAADATEGMFRAIAQPRRRLRPDALAEQAIYIGSQALGIVGLISFLVGLTLAFQSAYQLRQFGAAIFVANLTGVAMVREMGPLMTAILVAGRSGSSIAAEISTMKVAEELDALTVMGLDPVAYLAVPRLLAIILMLPLLTVLANVLGVLGGFLVGVLYLDISVVAFGRQIIDSLAPNDLFTGLVKSAAFAWGIGLIGLFYGFRVQGGAAEVGRATTASVVASIFFIIVADCVFSVLFYIVL